MVMFDSIDVGQIPTDATACAGYLDGNWVTVPELQRLFPHAHLLSITIGAAVDADCLDVESGDATVSQAPGWVKRQLARKYYRPAVYANASTMPVLLAALESAGIGRAQVRLWSAHYGLGAHICGPHTCGYPGIVPCDGTQWTPNALGRDLDESLLLGDFFAPPPEPPVKITSWKSDGKLTLAEAAHIELKTAISTVIRATALRGPYSPSFATFLDDIFTGKTTVTDPVPPDITLWGPA